MTVRLGQIYECHNAHIICQECHGKLVQPRKCPSCKEKMPDPPPRNVAIERMIDRQVSWRLDSSSTATMKGL